MKRFIIVSGLPGAGKSTVGSALAMQSGFRLFDKDQILESYFAESCPSNPAERRVLSDRADRALERAVGRRHPGHLDARWYEDALLAQFTEAAAHGALRLGAAITVDASQPVDADALWKRVQEAGAAR